MNLKSLQGKYKLFNCYSFQLQYDLMNFDASYLWTNTE